MADLCLAPKDELIKLRAILGLTMSTNWCPKVTEIVDDSIADYDEVNPKGTDDAF
jgi:hypothetical protein